MLDFRKVLIALSVAGLGLVGTASAQVASISGATIAPAAEGYVAAEGMTEILPTITLTVNNPGSITGSLYLTLSSNAPFNNQVVKPGLGVPAGQIDVTAQDNVGDTAGGATGSVTQTGAATIQVVFNSIKNTAATITITGLRSNASALPAGSQITISMTSPSILIAAGQFPINVAYTAASISSASIAGGGNVNTCTVTSAVASVVATATIVNGFPDSLKTIADYTVAGNIVPTQGTVLAVTFNNLNPGVNYYVPNTIGTAPAFSVAAYNSPIAIAANAAVPATAPSPAAGLVPLSSTGTIYYAVTTSVNGTESLVVPLTAVLPSTGVTTFTTTDPSVSVVVTGSATAIDPATAYPEYSASATPVTGSQSPFTGSGIILPCQTTLLFPYVINVAGFDTGLSITNAQTGKGATSGTCNVTFYGTGNPATNPYVTALIPPATASATNTSLPLGVFDVGTVAPGFEGFVIAACNFQGAHGYAFVSDGLGTGTGIASNYLAVVLSDSGAAATVTQTAF